jgi:hypothetical protein
MLSATSCVSIPETEIKSVLHILTDEDNHVIYYINIILYILYYIVLFYTILYNFIICVILNCIILFLYRIILYFTVYYTILYYLYCII